MKKKLLSLPGSHATDDTECGRSIVFLHIPSSGVQILIPRVNLVKRWLPEADLFDHASSYENSETLDALPTMQPGQ